MSKYPTVGEAARADSERAAVPRCLPAEARPQAAAGCIPSEARAAYHQVPAASQGPAQVQRRAVVLHRAPGGARLHARCPQVRQRQYAPDRHHRIRGNYCHHFLTFTTFSCNECMKREPC